MTLALGFPQGPVRSLQDGDQLQVGSASEPVVVPSNWDLVPDGVGRGEPFRLLFVSSSTTDASSAEIEDYNLFVREEAAIGRSGLLEYKDHFWALASTASVDARTNTATNPSVIGFGVPIFWLLGPKAADDYRDFYDGSWDHYDPGRKRDGAAIDFTEEDRIYTGTRINGSAAPAPLGGTGTDSDSRARVGIPGKGAELDSGHDTGWDKPLPLYAISGVFEVENAATLGVGLGFKAHGELTAADQGRDWYAFDASAGERYVVELSYRMRYDALDPGGAFDYPGHMVDPSILEIVNSGGVQVLAEHDRGGFCCNSARAFFEPEEDGRFRVAVGAGAQDRGDLGHYTISIRMDDHADDFRTDRHIVLRTNGSISARIDSDVAPDDPGIRPWDWAVWKGSGDMAMRPRRGIETIGAYIHN